MVKARRPVVAEGKRNRKVEVWVNTGEALAMDEQMKLRRCQTRGDYLRYLFEADVQGNLLVIDDGFKTMCEAVGRAFGGLAAELTAQADLYRIQKGMSEL